MSEIITVTHADACQDGFGNLENCVDAVFLDLPSPWLSVPFATKALKIGRMICSFSPCIEQVQRMAQSLKLHGYTGEIKLRFLSTTIRELLCIGSKNWARQFSNCLLNNKIIALSIEDLLSPSISSHTLSFPSSFSLFDKIIDSILNLYALYYLLERLILLFSLQSLIV